MYKPSKWCQCFVCLVVHWQRKFWSTTGLWVPAWYKRPLMSVVMVGGAVKLLPSAVDQAYTQVCDDFYAWGRRLCMLGCIFLPESSGFLYFPFRSTVFHRNLNFCSAVILFIGIKRSKNLRSKTKASGVTSACLGTKWYSFASCNGLITGGYTRHRRLH